MGSQRVGHNLVTEQQKQQYLKYILYVTSMCVFLSKKIECFYRQDICAWSVSHVQLFATLQTIARQAPLSMGILQVRILEWVTIPFSRGSS